MKLTQYFPFLFLPWYPKPDSSSGMVSQVPSRGHFPWPGHGALILLSMGYSSILTISCLFHLKVLSCRTSQPVLHSPSNPQRLHCRVPGLCTFLSRALGHFWHPNGFSTHQCMECFPPPRHPATSVLLTANLLAVCVVSLPRLFTGINHIDPVLTSGTSSGAQLVTEHQLSFLVLITKFYFLPPSSQLL